MRQNLGGIVAVFVAGLFCITLMLPNGAANASVIIYQQGLNGYSNATDLTVYKQVPTSNYAFSATMQVGNYGESDEMHSLFGFDNIFGNLPGQIPLGSTINSATLSLSNTGIAIPAAGALYRMTSPWIDLLDTWDTLVDGVNNNPLGEYDPTPSYSGPIGSGPLDVASIVQDWSNGAPNYGIAFLPTATGVLAFGSSDNASVAHRPYLTIDYTVPEPTALSMMVLGATLCVRRRRR